MIRQPQRHAVTQRGLGQLILRVEEKMQSGYAKQVRADARAAKARPHPIAGIEPQLRLRRLMRDRHLVDSRVDSLFSSVLETDGQDQDQVPRMSLDANVPAAPAPLYARFSRLMRGIVVDWIIAMAVLFGAVAVAISVESDNFSRVLGFFV